MKSRAQTQLPALIDRGFDTLIANLIAGLTAKDADSKPGAPATELTKALEAATKWQTAKWAQDGDRQGAWGSALGKERGE